MDPIPTETAPATSTRFKPGKSGNVLGRPKGAGLAREMMLSRQEELITKLIEKALGGDVNALRICMERMWAPLRPETPVVSSPQLAAAVGLTAKANEIIAAVGRSEIGPDVAVALLQGLAAAGKVIETDDLQARIEAIEQRIK